jgi:hypothetical protein
LTKKYEVTNMQTGEIEEIETSVDLDLLQQYNEWVVEQKLNPPKYSPREYAEYVEIQQLKANVLKAIDMINKYDYNVPWTPEMVASIREILENDGRSS